MDAEQRRQDHKKMNKRTRLLLGVIILSLIEIIYFYFMGKPYNYVNGLDDLIDYIIVGNIAFFVVYFVLIDGNQFRKKYMLFAAAYALLLAAPFFFHSKMPQTKVEEAQALIVRTEGGKVIKDRDYANVIKTYEGKEVYLVAVEKGDRVYRYAFDPDNQQYYSFSK